MSRRECMNVKVEAELVRKALGKSAEAEKLIDDTNADPARRAELVGYCRRFAERVDADWIVTPVADCLARNAARDSQIPVPIIMQMHHQLSERPPSQADGFDMVICHA